MNEFYFFDIHNHIFNHMTHRIVHNKQKDGQLKREEFCFVKHRVSWDHALELVVSGEMRRTAEPSDRCPRLPWPGVVLSCQPQFDLKNAANWSYVISLGLSFGQATVLKF